MPCRDVGMRAHTRSASHFYFSFHSKSFFFFDLIVEYKCTSNECLSMCKYLSECVHNISRNLRFSARMEALFCYCFAQAIKSKLYDLLEWNRFIFLLRRDDGKLRAIFERWKSRYAWLFDLQSLLFQLAVLQLVLMETEAYFECIIRNCLCFTLRYSQIWFGKAKLLSWCVYEKKEFLFRLWPISYHFHFFSSQLKTRNSAK